MNGGEVFFFFEKKGVDLFFEEKGSEGLFSPHHFENQIFSLEGNPLLGTGQNSPST